MTTQDQRQAPRLWAIVELFGHQRIAGAISEQNFGGAHLVRLDVPEVKITEKRYDEAEPRTVTRIIEAHTRSFGAGAIYSINWCDETTAHVAAQSIKHEPMQPYSVRAALQNLPEEHRTRLLTVDPDDDDDPDRPF